MLQKDSEISLPEAIYHHEYVWHPIEGSVKGCVTLAERGANDLKYFWMENLNNADLKDKRHRFGIAELIAEARTRATLKLVIGPAVNIKHSRDHQFLCTEQKGVGIYLFDAANVGALTRQYPAFHSYESSLHDISTPGGLLEAIHRLDILFELRKRHNWRFNEEFQKALNTMPKLS
ncbi:hypothetical protein A3F00_00205 [Candidatus Daviesbacteria bacterium RIFCSPHIGHO2_12_FULL_37_11]|uniref:Uncharacterized protein n=1 Tax=Candidatus Daviesbacteria bacterium RIFCSPHIGHO2_12_FULL_37_11 TaxID=1797777 RepID=A0A1F5KBA7_9BACT|nr:MAG: hypothetical protein A2769_00925 [Candidatus Daviesbacteria bacterium RIFCSPHIGHO2_01_FULL_37_27]OGE37901.1 MAG: hypothetical protein A3F00_00205 [Candidatus Daviesbacteria bacterium RIFCSPHIGHO2_12_FULL_37_11]OGE46365.1 MAG: hypothetical protein A3B39_00080 [Candidatus Daviesbacteria bacterium RIFCSPLOWO2_01_FULL_37_10]